MQAAVLTKAHGFPLVPFTYFAVLESLMEGQDSRKRIGNQLVAHEPNVGQDFELVATFHPPAHTRTRPLD